MSTTSPASGSCLCGAVTLAAPSLSRQVGACHCSMCRQWSGGPFLGLDCGSDLQVTGSAHVGIFASSEWAERGFCKDCGSHLYYRLKPTGQYIVPAGLFGDGLDLHFDHQIFIDEKPGYYSFAEKTREQTGAEVFAEFGAGDVT